MTAISTPTTADPSALLARTAHLDRLRVILTVLVVLHHTAIGYGAAGSWFFRTANPPGDAVAALLTLFTAVNQAFFMGAFFLVAGYFSAPSLARKGGGAFLRDRLIRLGIPLLVFGFLLGPWTVAIARSATGEGALAGFLALVAEARFVIGPLWFALALLLFSAALVLWNLLHPARTTAPAPVPPAVRWLPAALGVGAAALAIRQIVPVGEEILGLQLGYFASYAFLFFLGCAAAPHRWLDRVGWAEARPWSIAALGAIPILPIVLLTSEADPLVFETGFSVAAVTYAFWEPVVAFGVIAGLIAALRGGARERAPLWDTLAANAYAAFILHAPVIVALAVLLDPLRLPALLGVLVVGGGGAALSFALGALVRRSPLVRRVV